MNCQTTIKQFFFIIQLSILISTTGYSQSYKYFNYNVEDGLPSPQVYDSYEDDFGYIWFTTDRGMCRYNGSKFETFTSKQGLENITNFRIYPTGHGHFWICSIGASISYWDGTQFQAFKFNNKIESLVSKENKWLTIVNCEEKNISVFFENNSPKIPKKIHKINTVTGQISTLPFSQIKIGSFAPSNTKFYLSKVDKYASISDSIYYNKLRPFLHDIKGIISVFLDNQNNIYVGTYNGLIIYKNGNINNPKKILKDAAITSIEQSSSGTIIVTTLGKGVFFIPSIKIHKYNFNNIVFKHEMFQKSIIADENIYFKSDKNIIIELDNDEKPTISLGLTNYSALHFTLLHLSNGDLFHYIPSYSHFHILSQEDKIKNKENKLKNDRIVELLKNPNISKNYYKRVLCAIEDHNHNLWIGTDKHLYKHKINENSFVDSMQIEAIPIEQNNIRISKLCTDINGIWIATLNNGLFYRLNDGEFIKIDAQKLLSHTIHSIFLDGSNLYIATNRGLNIIKYKIEHKNLTILNITSINSASGLLSDYILDVNKWHDKIWLTTNDGICYYKPDELKIHSDFPKLFIKGIFVNKHQVKTSKLASNQSDLTIEFDAPTLIHLPSEKFRFKYHLDNLKWSKTNNSYVSYNELNPGPHTFSVQCSNLNGEWSNSKTIDFFIEYPYYEKTWFRILGFLIFGAIIWFIFKLKERQLKKKAQKEIAYKEIELGMLRNQINPHFTFNSLNMIQSHIFSNNPIKANEHLGKLSHLIRKGLELTRLKTISIQEEITFIESYLNLEKERFGDELDFSIMISPKLKNTRLKIPPLMTQPIIENILKHAFKQLNKKGKITVEYILLEDYLQININDNGTGFDVKKNISKQSLGLEITKKRIEILNEINDFKSSIIISSKMGIGTNVILKLPTNL